jgi:hypothetical protein
MDIQQAIIACKEATKQLQATYDFRGEKRKGGKTVCFHDTYDQSCEMYDSISIHAVKGKFPDKLFAERSPNQTDQEFEYIRKNYKQFTLPVFTDFINTIQNCFADGNWSISYREPVNEVEKKETFKDYVEGGIKTFGSLENFVKFILPNIKTIDANGYVAIRPYEIPTIENGQGELVVSDELYEPTPYYFKCSQVVAKKENEYLLVLSNEKSEVKTGNTTKKVGYVFEFYTKNEIYKIKQIGRQSDQDFIEEIWLKHDLNKLQATPLMGLPQIDGETLFWQSPFIYATDILDVIATNANILQLIINNCAFPIKAMYGTPCDFTDTENGVVCIDGELNYPAGQKPCHKCGGTGLKNRLSPLGVLLLNPKGKTTDGDSSLSQKPIEFYAPSTEILEFVDKKIDKDFEKAYKNLHLHTSNSQVQGSQDMTATGTFAELKAKSAFIKPISDQMFSIWDFMNECIGKQRYGADFEKPTLVYPKSFDFKTPEDYLNELSEAISKGLPPAIQQLILMRYIDSVYSDSEKTPIVFRLIIAADRLFGMTNADIALKLARQTVSKEESILHDSALLFIMDLEREDPKFFEKDLSYQVEKLKDMAKKTLSVLTPEGTSLQADLGGGS